MTVRTSKPRYPMPALILLAAALTGCASQDYASFRAIPAGTVVQVNTSETRADMPNVRSTGESAGRYAAVGMGKGAAGGAAVGFQIGLACGPFVIICGPVLAIAGAGAGIVVGGIGGSIVGAVKGLPKEKADAFEALIESTMAENDPSQALRDKFAALGGEHWTIADPDSADVTPDATVTIDLGAFWLQQFKDNELELHIQSTMAINYGADKTRTFLFNYQSKTRNIDEWIDTQNKVFEQEVNKAYAAATQEMITTLTW